MSIRIGNFILIVIIKTVYKPYVKSLLQMMHQSIKDVFGKNLITFENECILYSNISYSTMN